MIVDLIKKILEVLFLNHYVLKTIQGFFSGSVPVAQAYIADVTTTEKRSYYIGIINAAVGVAITLGPGKY